ncbi:hypothetical protein ACLKA7_011207 [Drosophila subpalustris]
MKLLLVIAVLCGAAVAVSVGEGSTLLNRLFHRESKATTTTTTTTPEPQRQIFVQNNVPHVAAGCTAHFTCKKKLTALAAPHPCVKYCLNRVECPNNQIQRGKPSECVLLDEAQVQADFTATHPTDGGDGGPTTEKIMQVAMIDFPCQPGYLPDSRGRCREIW